MNRIVRVGRAYVMLCDERAAFSSLDRVEVEFVMMRWGMRCNKCHDKLRAKEIHRVEFICHKCAAIEAKQVKAAKKAREAAANVQA